MSEWKKVTLGELIDSGECAIYDNLRKPLSKIERNKMKYGNLYPYYGAAGVIDFINNYCFDGYYLLIAEDGTITSDGTKPMLQLANGKFWVSNHAHVLQCKNEWKTKFLYYALLNVDINPYITGSVQPKLNQENLFSIPLLIPKSELEQRAIASVLSSLDDKIDLLHRENRTLEAMAETLFRQWFIEEAEDDWEEVSLKDIYTFEKGFEPGSDSYLKEKSEDAIRFIRVKDLPEDTASIYIRKNIAEKICTADDLLMSFDGTPGKLNFGLEGAYSSGIRKIYSTNPLYNNLGLKYLIFKSKSIQDTIKAYSDGTVIIHAGSSIDNLVFSFPDENKIAEFNNLIDPIFTKIQLNKVQIRTLTQLRDTLLPKLMSGEVRVDLCQS